MDLRRERKKQNRIFGFVITLAAVLFSSALAIIILIFSKPELSDDYNHIGGLDKRAETVSLGIEGVSGILNSKDEFSFEINSEIVFKNCDSKGKILLKNPLKNRYLMQADIVIEGDTFLSTGYIAPGQIIKEAIPDIKLFAGKYKAIALISAIDPTSGNKLDTVKQSIYIIIKN